MNNDVDRKKVLLIGLGLIILTFVAFEPICHNEFINFDDTGYITENQHVQDGLTFQSIKWAFTTMHRANWHPLTWLSHMLDCQLFGLEPSWHHTVNLLFHAANTLLLLWILTQMTSSVLPCAFVAACFALHPLHVESVAWASERKDVLSAFFFMLTLAAYLKYAKRPCLGRYLSVILLFILGLLAKPMLVTLPFVLLLLDYWPLGRVRADFLNNPDIPSGTLGNSPICPYRSIRYLLFEKLPLLMIAAVSCGVTFIAQKNWGAMTDTLKLPLADRVSNAVVSVITYLIKMVYPRGLALLYPYPVNGIPVWKSTAAFILLLVITIYVFRSAKTRRYIAVGWLWYLVMLVPVCGLIQVGEHALADRYTYLPLIGIFIIIAWGVPDLAANLRYRKIGSYILAGVLLVSMLIATRAQAAYWKNDLTLFGRSVDVTKNNHVMHNNYGNALAQRGLLDEAAEQYLKVLTMKPRYLKTLSNLGKIFQLQGKTDEAIIYFRRALDISPKNIKILNNLGLALQKQGTFDDSIIYLNESLRIRPGQPDILDNLAFAYYNLGEFDKAIQAAERAVKIAELSGNNQLVRIIQQQLDQYKKERP